MSVKFIFRAQLAKTSIQKLPTKRTSARNNKNGWKNVLNARKLKKDDWFFKNLQHLNFEEKIDGLKAL